MMKHWSSCAVHNGPALPVGPCDCGGVTPERRLQFWNEGNAMHGWDTCPMCGPTVICGKCGNNCCNAGHGTLPDGSDCDACQSAHEMDRGRPYPGESPAP